MHRHQQLSFWNGHNAERYFLTIYVYDKDTGRPVAMTLLSGKTKQRKEAEAHSLMNHREYSLLDIATYHLAKSQIDGY